MGEKDLLTPVQAQLLKPLSEEELYDLEKDPYETVNLVGNQEYNAVHRELKLQMTDWIKMSNDQGLKEDSDAIVEHFKSYGITTMNKSAKRIEAMRSSVEKHFE